MKRTNPQLQYRPHRRGAWLNESRFGPIVRLALVLSGVAAAVLLTVFVLLPYMRGRAPAADASVPRPAAVAQAQPQTDDVRAFATGAVQTVALPEDDGALVLADPSAQGTKLLFAAGASGDRLDRLVRYDAETGASETVTVSLANDSVRNPVESAGDIAYIDAKAAGGGTIMLLEQGGGDAWALCELPSGMPALYFEAPYLVWQMRTAERITKLIACDVAAAETVTLTVFGDTAGAQSDPSLRSGLVLFADAGADTPERGFIRAVQLGSDSSFTVDADTLVHDPKSYGSYWGWLSGNHGARSDLCLAEDGGAGRRIARGVIDFDMAAWGVAYCRDETVFAYRYADDKTYVISETGTNAQLAAVSDSVVVWRDMTDAAHPVWNYMRLD